MNSTLLVNPVSTLSDPTFRTFYELDLPCWPPCPFAVAQMLQRPCACGWWRRAARSALVRAACAWSTSWFWQECMCTHPACALDPDGSQESMRMRPVAADGAFGVVVRNPPL